MPRLRSTLARVGAVVGLSLAGLAPVTAHAAVIADPVKSITVTPSGATTADPYSTFTTLINWCVPDGSRPGDSFQVLLPDLLGSWPASFPLKSTSGAVVADGAINPGPPSVLTITLAPTVAGLTNVCGTATLQANARNSAALPGTTEPLHYQSGTTPWDFSVTFGRSLTNTYPRKWGTFNGVDQCRIDGVNCLKWGVETQLGPVAGEVTIADTASGGQTFDCSRLVTYFVDASGAYVRLPARYEYTVDSCTTTSFHVTFHNLPDGLKGTAVLPASASPTAAGGVTYTNTATVAVGGWQTNVSASLTSNQASGTGIGTAITVRKSDSNGNAGDTRQTRVKLPSGTAKMVITATNSGLDPLTDVVVDDTTFTGLGTVTGLTCDFSTAVAGAPTTGTTWKGPWPAGSTISCTGTLAGVTPAGHGDVATFAGTTPGGTVVRGRDVYYAYQPAVSIGDHVWWDANRNGVQDAGEKPAPGVKVQLVDSHGAVVRTTTTDANGFYAFVNLTPGARYTLVVTPPKGATFTRPVAGANRALDSNVDRYGRAPVVTPLDGRNLVDTPDDPTYDAGLVPSVPASVSVGDRVWYDTNRNGIQDAGEKGLRGVVVSVVGPTGRPVVDVRGRPVPAQRTDVNGHYLFTGLPTLAAGQHYTVRAMTPAGFAPTSPGRGRDRSRDSSTGTAATIAPLATNGASDLTLDFGFWRPVKHTYVVELDRYFPNIAGNRAATLTNQRLVASLDDDGILRYRENMGTGCFSRRASATCMWQHSDWRMLTVSVTTDASVAPTVAQVVQALNAARPRGWEPLVSTTHVSTVSGTISFAWLLGKGATPTQAWGPRHDIPEIFLAHS